MQVNTQELVSNNIRLRPVSMDDVPFMCELYGNKINMRYLNHREDPKELHEAVCAIVERSLNQSINDISFVIVENTTNADIGITGIQWSLDKDKDVEVGIILSNLWHRKGIGHSAKSIVIQHAFEYFKVDSVNAYCGLDNVPANQANIKLGFKLNSVIHHQHIGKDANHWKISKEEYLCQKKRAV